MKNTLLILSVLMALFIAGKSIENNNPFILNGHISGISKGEIVLLTFAEKGYQTDTSEIVNGNFQFKGYYPKLIMGTLRLKLKCNGEEVVLKKQIMLENVKMNFNGSVNDFENAKITGSVIHDDYERCKEGKKQIRLKYERIKQSFPKYNPNASDEDKKALQAKYAKHKKELNAAIKQYEKDFMQKNPNALYSSYLFERATIFRSYEQLYELVKDLHPDLKKQPYVAKVISKVENMRRLEIGLDKIMDGVDPVSYQVDKEYKGKRVLDVIYLASFKNNELCALKKDGTIIILDEVGKVTKRFKPTISGKPTAISVDIEDNIYVFSSEMKLVKKKIRGRMVSKELPVGVECQIFSKEGEAINKYKLSGVHIASGSRVVDQHLIVSDCKLKKIQIHDRTSGEFLKEIDDMRACCGILDFSVNQKKEIIVANLGAFRVQGFDYNGNSLMAFGKRGKEVLDFHGCCNPVSVATLSSGAIVTVEKDPTRIKVYSNKGAKQIEGIEELVKGCTYIPMIVDSKENLYLASEEKGIVKCCIVK
ncbi:DUF4369 domain-containing protein [Marinifilum fragile]|uniref:DUF4369 domain-containing protein n=1 Tax=Marinifilum fragile TaxID=570161 RepID=UPI002AA86C92|nr:DUF4369 domain-containing protein [Marinifilum fragile]